MGSSLIVGVKKDSRFLPHDTYGTKECVKTENHLQAGIAGILSSFGQVITATPICRGHNHDIMHTPQVYDLAQKGRYRKRDRRLTVQSLCLSTESVIELIRSPTEDKYLRVFSTTLDSSIACPLRCRTLSFLTLMTVSSPRICSGLHNRGRWWMRGTQILIGMVRCKSSTLAVNYANAAQTECEIRIY